MKGTFKIHLRFDKTLKSGMVPMEIVYSVSNQRKYLNTGEKIYPKYWNQFTQKCIYLPVKDAKKVYPSQQLHSQMQIDAITNRLDCIYNRIRSIEQDFVRSKTPFSSHMVINAFKEQETTPIKKEEPRNYLFDFIANYIEENKPLRVKGSLSVYKSLAKHLGVYQNYLGEHISFESIDYHFFQSFHNFLISRTVDLANGESIGLLNNTTIAKLLSTLKTFLGYAKRRGVVLNPDYKDYRIVRQELEVIALTQEELNRLFLCDLSNDKRLANVRDVFCFSCFTGLRYSDLKQLRWEHIKSTEIVLTITKTKSRLSIPLSDYSSAILDKYKQAGRPLPVISSQNMNYALKELGELVGIDEQIEIVRYRGVQRIINVYPKHRLLTIHTGRKTFATLSLERGMSAEETMCVTGHSDYKSFKRYVRITEERKKIVMNRAWGAPETII